jgi:nucleoside-diphosphate-sugar epimerase
MEAVAMDISESPRFETRWQEPDVLVHCASSGRGGADVYRRVYLEGLNNLLSATRAGHVIFVSSTSVYAQSDGSVVTEESPAEPRMETGRILREAEQVTIEAGGSLLRLSGIYGPGRSVLLRKYLEGSAVLESGGDRWINQIHRDDAARAVVHAATNELTGIYNVSDSTPARQKDVYAWIAAACGGHLPPEGPAPTQRKRGITNKRVSNAKLRACGWSPLYSSYREALPSLLKAV